MKMRPMLWGSLLAVTIGIAALSEAAEVIVRVAPPPPVSTAVIGVAPGPRYVWVPGYHRWNGAAYVWVAGRWVMPPRAGVVWVPPHWAPRSGGYVFVPGHWR
jgi:hypothetical protein